MFPDAAQRSLSHHLGGFLDTGCHGRIAADCLIRRKPSPIPISISNHADWTALSPVMHTIRKRVFNDSKLSETDMMARGKTLALLALILWVGAVTAGRLLAYTFTRTNYSGYESGENAALYSAHITPPVESLADHSASYVGLGLLCLR
jgi:hypothetical protein